MLSESQSPLLCCVRVCVEVAVRVMDVLLSGVRAVTDQGGLFLPLGGVGDTERVQPLIPEGFY